MEAEKIPANPTLAFKRRHVLERMVRVWKEQKAQLVDLRLKKQAARIEGLIDSASTVLWRLEEK